MAPQLQMHTVLGIIFLSLISATAHLSSSVNRFSPKSSWDRKLQGTAVTTSACDNIRTERFPAKLELVYFYVIETNSGQLNGLSGVEDAILRAVLDALHSCDAKGFPEYALDLATKHELSKNGFCIPQGQDTVCNVVKGKTYIYLDARVNEARDAAYTAIEQALADQSFMILFEPAILRSRFEESIQENLIIVPSESSVPDEEVEESKTSSSTVKVAIAISSVAFVVASIFSYGFLRRQSKLNVRQQSTIARRQQEHRRKAARRGRRYFTPLGSDDENHSGPLIHLAKSYHEEGRSSIWSVSDMTSDAGSVQSILSKVSSRLEKIEEEPSSNDDNDDRADIEASIQRELAMQTETGANDLGLSSYYIAAYTAHKDRLRAIVKNALFDSDLEDEFAEGYDEDEERITPKTEESKSASFDSPDDYSTCLSLAPPSLIEDPSELSTVGHYHTPESAKTPGGMISVLTMDEFPEVNLPSDQPEKFLPEGGQLNDQSSYLLGLDLDLSRDPKDSDAGLQRWLARLLHELQASTEIKRIEM